MSVHQTGGPMGTAACGAPMDTDGAGRMVTCEKCLVVIHRWGIEAEQRQAIAELTKIEAVTLLREIGLAMAVRDVLFVPVTPKGDDLLGRIKLFLASLTPGTTL